MAAEGPGARRPRDGRWNLSGPTAIQVQDGWAVEALRFAHGRTLAQVRSALSEPGS